METRNVKITIQQAANWYSSNNDTLKVLALSAFSRDEIILYYVKTQSKTVSLDLPKGQIDKFKTLAQLMNIAKYYNGDWKPDWNNPNEYKYFIVYNCNTYKVDYNWTSIYDRVYFKNKKDAQSVIDNLNFRAILNDIYKN